MRYFAAAFLICSSLVICSTLYARAQGVEDGRAREAALYDAGPDPVVASDHAPRPALDVPATAPADDAPKPSLLDDALDIAGSVGRGALGGMALLAIGKIMAWAREKRRWLRRGVVGNVGSVVVAVLLLFGGVLATGGSVPLALTAVGSAMAGGALLSRDPKTMRRVPDEPAPVREDVPT